MSRAINDFIIRYRLAIAVCFSYAAFCIATSALTGLNIYAFLIWNLFLAVIPFVLSSILVQRKQLHPAIAVILFVVWLLFIPNAFYLITDLIHLSQFTFYYHTGADFTNPVYIHDLRIYLGLIVIAAGVAIATLIGLASLRQIHRYLDKHTRHELPIMLVIFALIGFGIYLGRFLRFNSWDIINPISLVTGLLNNLNIFTIGFTILMGATTAILYALYYKYQLRHENK